MPPSSQDPPQGPRRLCAIAPHLLKEPTRCVRDPQLLRFAQLINSEMRMGSIMCLGCYQNLLKLFRVKMANARAHQQRREASGTSMTNLSNNQRMESSSDLSVPPPGGVTMRRNQPTGSPRSRDPSTSSDEVLEAAAKRQRTEENSPPPAAANTSDDTDDYDAESNLSLNAVNGTRLPHIQPIPKRRQFVHLNKIAMDIYLAGTTGG